MCCKTETCFYIKCTSAVELSSDILDDKLWPEFLGRAFSLACGVDLRVTSTEILLDNKYYTIRLSGLNLPNLKTQINYYYHYAIMLVGTIEILSKCSDWHLSVENITVGVLHGMKLYNETQIYPYEY